MRKVILTVAIFAAGLNFFEKLSAQEIPHFEANDIPNVKIASEKTYEGDGLYGYMDGGAELYIAYGFDKLLRQEVELDDNKFTILIYRMTEPQAAFGIYSLCRDKCDSSIRTTRTECATAYLYMAERDKFYYSVINQSVSKKARQQTLDFARILAGKIHPDSIPWPDLFNMDLFIGYQTSLKYIRGNIALQQVLIDWSPYFESIKDFSAWYLPVKNEKTGNFYLALISFPDAADSKTFIKNTSLSLQKLAEMNFKKGKIGWMIGEHEILFLDATGFNEPLEPYANAIYQFLDKLNKKK